MRWTATEAAASFAVVGSVLAVVVPSCIRTVRLSRTAEATENLERLTRAVVALEPNKPLTAAPLTPAMVPRGGPVSDPAGTWEHPGWKALSFALDEPHWYAYRVDVDDRPGVFDKVHVVAHGDLDGDGLLSTYSRAIGHDGKGWVPATALVINADLE